MAIDLILIQYLANNEKELIANYFTTHLSEKYNLDISLDPTKRFSAAGYAKFLLSCKGQIGTESGYDYFSLTDSKRIQVNKFVGNHPNYSFDEIYKKFFSTYPLGVSMRIISGRQVEAAACKTIQLLFEGCYSGFLLPDIHYIPLKKDFSNIDEALEKFEDESFCLKLTSNAYDLVSQRFTYERLIKDMITCFDSFF